MKSVLLALGVGAGCGGAAMAQSQVEVYGLVDVAIEHVNRVGADHQRLTRMPGLTGSLPSRLGFRGKEDLGGGLQAVFALESGFGVDTGTFNQGGRTFGRQAWAGLAGRWGTLSLGRQYTMLYWSQLDADILGPQVFSSASLDSYLPNARADNALAYRGSFNGLTWGASYSWGRDTVNAGPSPAGTNCAGESAVDSQACRQWSLLAKYDRPTWGVAVALDRMRGGPKAYAELTASSMQDRRTTVTGWTQIGRLKLGAGWIARRNDAAPATPRSQLWYLGAAYTVDPAWVLDGAVYQLRYAHSPDRAMLLALRSTYQFSKRTAVYATVGHMDNHGALALAVSSAAAGGVPEAGGRQSGVALGVRHAF